MSYAIEASLAPTSTGPSTENQTLEFSELSLLRLTLNQVDYGLVVVDADSAEDAVAKLDAGASLVQLYSGFIYRGPALVSEVADTLAYVMKKKV